MIEGFVLMWLSCSEVGCRKETTVFQAEEACRKMLDNSQSTLDAIHDPDGTWPFIRRCHKIGEP